MHSSSRLNVRSARLLFNTSRLAHSQASSSTPESNPKRRQLRLSDQFGNLTQQFVQTNKLVSHNRRKRIFGDQIIDDKWDHFNVEKNIPIIDTPIKGFRKKEKTSTTSIKQFSNLQGVDFTSAKVLIQCARSEFNHYEGMRYPTLSRDLPLVSQFWHKNKYADDWFTIKRTQNTHITNQNYFDRTWEEFIHLIHPQVYRNIAAMKFKAPTKIQYDFFKAYPTVDHVFMAAETGSGKTLGYGAPILSKLLFLKEKQPNAKALVLTPSTHLKGQTLQKLKQLAGNTPLKVLAPIKGEKYTADDFDVLVSTPGMAYSILKQLGDSTSIQYLIMDESDMMLDDSFEDDIANLLSIIPVKHSCEQPDATEGAQMVFASATCPLDLTDLVNEIVNEQHILYVTSRHLHKLMPNIEQQFIRVREDEKMKKLVEIITNMNLNKNRILIFCKDKITAEQVSRELSEQYGFSNVLMAKTKDSFEKLDDEMAQVLISTDLGGRGLDIEKLTHVVNYDFPKHLVDYVHRVGRVGRCSSQSQTHKVTSFVRKPWEVKHVNSIELAARLNRPIQGIETNVAGLIKERRAEQRDQFR